MPVLANFVAHYSCVKTLQQHPNENSSDASFCLYFPLVSRRIAVWIMS